MQARIAPSLGALEGTHQEVWGTTDYVDQDEPVVFFGLYGLPDFYKLWRHKGKKYIIWAGSDIRHLIDGYWLDEHGQIRLENKRLAEWVNKNCESWVENTVEYEALLKLGIESQICPSFMGDVNDYEVSYENNGKYYASVSGNDFELYGWDKVNKLAEQRPQDTFYLYGNTVKWDAPDNVIVRGRMPKEQMNEEIKLMTGGVRLVNFDGFSEIIAKSLLWGQYPISTIEYPGCNLPPAKKPNILGRDWVLNNVNQFPWNEHKTTH